MGGNKLDIKDILIDENCSMIEAMALIDKVAKKILFVTHADHFVASITDGDIRRWILKKGNMDARVKDIANYAPKSLHESKKNLAKDYMRKNSVESLPLLNDEGEIVSVVLWNDEKIERKKKIDVPVVIMAGGMGTRLYPYTKILPKPLIPIGEIPIIELIMNRFSQYGSDHFYVLVNHKKNMIKAYFNEIKTSYSISFIDEDQPLGTGGGLSLLKGEIHSTFILTNCDVLIEEDYEKIITHHKKENNFITMVCSLKKIEIPYGVIEIDDTGEIEKMREKPKHSFLINTGMYIVEPRVIEELKDNTSVSFPDIIEKHKADGKKIGIFPISENLWYDMGQLEEMEEMKMRLGLVE